LFKAEKVAILIFSKFLPEPGNCGFCFAFDD